MLLKAFFPNWTLGQIGHKAIEEMCKCVEEWMRLYVDGWMTGFPIPAFASTGYDIRGQAGGLCVKVRSF